MGLIYSIVRPSVNRDQMDRGGRVRRMTQVMFFMKSRSLAEPPIGVSVITRLDGRQIAQSVYKDLRERKVRNYETL